MGLNLLHLNSWERPKGPNHENHILFFPSLIWNPWFFDVSWCFGMFSEISLLPFLNPVRMHLCYYIYIWIFESVFPLRHRYPCYGDLPCYELMALLMATVSPQYPTIMQGISCSPHNMTTPVTAITITLSWAGVHVLPWGKQCWQKCI